METMSHSRAKTLGDCGHKYYLKYREHVPEKPSIALVGGSAFHAWVEAYERDKLGGDPVKPFPVYLDEALGQQVEATGLPVEDFKISGRKSKARPDGETLRVWATELGPEMVELYRQFDWGRWEIAHTIPNFEGGLTAGIEYPIKLDQPKWQGFVDQVRRDKITGNHMVLDVKTGQRLYLPSTQLEEYGAACRMLGLQVWYGGWYMARKGEFTWTPLRWSAGLFTQYVTDRHTVAEGGIFLPNIGDHCAWCPVRDHCKYA